MKPARNFVSGLLILICLVTVASAGGRSIQDVDAAERGVLMKAGFKALLDDGSASLRAARFKGESAPDSLGLIVLMCDFSDSLLYGRHGHVDGNYPDPLQSDWMYAAHDSIYFSHLMGDVRDYFHDVSGGAFELDYRIPDRVANLPRPMSYYGNHPGVGEQPVELALDVLDALDPHIDFRGYDTIAIVHAGAGEETDILGDSPEQIYTTYIGPEDLEAAVEEGLLEFPWLETNDVDGAGEPVRIDHVLILPENEYQDPIEGIGGNFGSVGVYCFEVGLRLGMLSLTDFTPAGYPDSQGIGQFGLMGYGLFSGAGIIPSHPCAFNKMLMGWLEPYEVRPDDAGFYSLYPSEYPAADSTLARVGIGPSEYWLLEYRLQDPDGNVDFSFTGDLNGNGLPDFDNAAYDSLGAIERFFDPDLDTRERLAGSEWDFFLSDNSARAPGVKGAGSGLYIWHIDEGVIRRVIDEPSNLLNADPDRKAVDLEEADGIQDLDVRIPTPYVLGGDHDSFRGEGNSEFGPATNPSTATAGGVPTGIVIDMISNVVADSTASDPVSGLTYIDYAERMRFRCRRVEAQSGAAVAIGERRLPGLDLRGSHLSAVDLDDSGDGVLEIVVPASDGRVLAFTHDLDDLAPGAASPGLWATGLDADGEPAQWNSHAVAGDLDGDTGTDLILTATSGLYAFDGGTGAELAGDTDPDSYGLFLALSGCRQPPVLLPAADPGASADQMDVVVCEEDETGLLHLLRIDGDGASVSHDAPAGEWRTVAPPVVWRGELIMALVSLDEDEAVLWMPLRAETIALPELPAELPMLPSPTALLIPARRGAVLLTDLEASSVTVWSQDADVLSGFAPGPAYVGDGAFHLAGDTGAPRTGWPFRPNGRVYPQTGPASPSPLVFEIDTQRRYLFTSRDGRLFLCDGRGRLADGWPLAAPGEVAGTPILIDLDGDPGLELAVAGTFDRITGPLDAEDASEADYQSAITAWTLSGTEEAAAVWPMYSGAPGGVPPVMTGGDDSRGTELIASGSHIAYPAPLIGDRLHIRALCNADAVVSVRIYNLEGEQVQVRDGLAAVAGDPFEIVLPAERLAAGPYLCRLEANSGRRTEISVISLVVAR